MHGKQKERKDRRAGFMLIFSLTVMAMLVLLSISISAILAVELRVSYAGAARAKARMNAVCAGRIALGELQRLAGPDRRITANAAILANQAGAGRPRLLGTWKGLTSVPGTPAVWSITNLPAVAPVSGGNGAYEKDHDNAFAGWLVSGVVEKTTPSAPPDRTREWRMLSGGGTAGYAKSAAAFKNGDDGDLYAMPETFSGNDADRSSGAFAWAVMDENQKARVDLRDDPDEGGDAERAALSASAARRFHPGYAADGTGAWRSQIRSGEHTILPDWNSLTLDKDDRNWFPSEPASGAVPARALRHDFTTVSVSLLTDVANGGLKRDIGMLPLMGAPEFDAIPGLGGNTGYVGFEASSHAATAGALAWWRSSKTAAIHYPTPGGASADGRFWPLWSDLREWAAFATTAKAVDNTMPGNPVVYLSGGVPTVKQISSATDTAKYLPQFAPSDANAPKTDRAYRSPWRQPVLYRYRIEMALYAEPDANSATTYTILPKANIIVQLWNPYDADMELDPTDSIGTSAPGLPFTLTMTGKDASGKPLTRSMKFIAWYPLTDPTGTVRQDALGGSVKLDGKIKAGGIRTYSVPMNVSDGGASVSLVSGYYPGHYKRFGKSVVNHYSTSGFDGMSPLDTVVLGLRTDTDNYKPPMYVSAPRAIGVPMRGDTRDGTRQNPTRIIGDVTTSAPSPVRLATAQGDKPLVVFEFRLKAEAFSGSDLLYRSAQGAADDSRDSERYFAGEPPGIWSQFQLDDGKKSTWYASPYESVVWSVDALNDSESKYPMEVSGASGESGFGGTGYSGSTGVESFVYHHIPTHPPVGLLSLRHARLGGGLRPVIPDTGAADVNPGLYNIHDAFGNALITPYVPTAEVTGTPVTPVNFASPAFTPYDMSWLMNAAIADSWFAGSLGAWDKGVAATLFPSYAQNAALLYAGFLADKKRLPDRRFVPDHAAPTDDTLLNGDTASAAAYRKIAAHLLVEGGFNLNSTSVRAWRAFLASSHADTPSVGSKTGILQNDGTALTVIAKTAGTAPVTVSDIVTAPPTATPESDNESRVNGGRTLADARLDALAVAVVAEVKKRGPFLTVGEFLNRRLEDGELGYKGAVQSAIDATGLNDHLKKTGRLMTSPGVAPNTDLQTVFAESGVNQPGWLSQADLLAPLATAMTVRGDTFVIRVSATADADDGARATLELTVRRTYRYIDATESDDTGFSELQSPANRIFGRRFQIVAVRRLSPEEI